MFNLPILKFNLFQPTKVYPFLAPCQVPGCGSCKFGLKIGPMIS